MRLEIVVLVALKLKTLQLHYISWVIGECDRLNWCNLERIGMWNWRWWKLKNRLNVWTERERTGDLDDDWGLTEWHCKLIILWLWWYVNRWVWSTGGVLLTGENWSTGRETYIVGGRWMNGYGVLVEWYWQGKTEVLGEKHYIAWVVCEWMGMKHWWNDTDRRKLKYWERNIIYRGW